MKNNDVILKNDDCCEDETCCGTITVIGCGTSGCC